MIKEFDSVVLKTDLPEHGLKQGDIGTIVLVHRGGEGYEVEFMTLDGGNPRSRHVKARVGSADWSWRNCKRPTGRKLFRLTSKKKQQCDFIKKSMTLAGGWLKCISNIPRMKGIERHEG